MTNNSGWRELSDIIAIPTFIKPNVSEEIKEDEGNCFNFIESEGNLTDQSHYFFYSMTVGFCVISVLIRIFRKQLMRLCECCRPRPTFEPKVTYHTSNEKMEVVDVKNMKKETLEVSEKTDKKSCLVIIQPKTVDPFLNHESKKVQPADKLAMKKQIKKSQLI